MNQVLLNFTETKREDVEFVYADLENIRNTLPVLEPEQQEDVHSIEERFKVGKGRMITNGTGTGKTFVGLGVVKRFLMMDKRNILIVVPSDKKCLDWIEESFKHFSIDINQLQGVLDSGEEVRVTTYANFYQNLKIRNVLWDLIIYDECHYLTQNSKGSETVYFEQHKFLANVYSTARSKASKYAGPYPERGTNTFRHEVTAWNEKYEKYFNRLVSKTKVLFLSATPFAYHKSLIIGDGTLWEMYESPKVENKHYSYNHPDPYQKFMIDNLGYRMKSNKLTIPEVGVDMDLMEKMFFEKQCELNVMSTRILELDKDYSRHFIRIASEEAELVDNGMAILKSNDFKKEFKVLHKFVKRHFNYMFTMKLLELMKAKHIHTRIQQHLALDRKIIIFHDFNNAVIEHPFRFDSDDLLTEEFYFMADRLHKDIMNFRDRYPDLWNMDLSNLKTTREQIRSHFPDVLEINGTIPKKKRSQNIDLFNDDASGKSLIMIQSKAGREGISLHDKTYVYDRVSLNLGLPTIPVAVTQEEGRSYRNGLKSNTIFEYATVQLPFERIAYAQKAAERSKTVENLAMGMKARDLETSFKEGYQNYTEDPPNILQGRGGKVLDRSIRNVSDFERAKTFFYAREKNRGRFKQRDYYWTPEPFGYKMVQWLNMEKGKSFLEPSAGHGAIGRWATSFTENTFIEPVIDLYSEMALNVKGKTILDEFENHNFINKYNYIAMNPPFGKGGSLAEDHLKLAMIHADHKGCTIMIILPEGPAMEKRLEKLYEMKEFKNWYVQAKLSLPSCLFKKAGTQAKCQLLKITSLGKYEYPKPMREFDFSHCETIQIFFDEIENLEL